MRALSIHDDLSYSPDAPNPTLQPGQALIKVIRAGICNTDLELVKGYLNFRGILGHEFVGEVVEGPSEWLGRRVVGEINISCGECDLCREGYPSQCRNRTTLGIRQHDGAMADYIALTTNNLHLVPDSVTDDQAVFTEPLAAALQITACQPVLPDQEVVLIGAGKLGMLCAQVLKLTGARVRAIARRPRQRDLLASWGIEPVTLEELPRNRAHVVVDCTGASEGFAAALDLVRPRGTIHLKSTYHGLPQADLSRVAVDEIRVVGSRCGPFPAALRLLESRAVEVESMIDARYPLDDALAAFEHAARPGTFKILLDM